jgi:hypothetical protein
VDWNAVQATYWSDPTVKERKQAEFLVHQRFPWAGIGAIGTIHQQVAEEVQGLLTSCEHRPTVAVKPDWYY